jgi:sentrin-specific protease 7
MNNPTSNLGQNIVVGQPEIIVVDQEQEHGDTGKPPINLTDGFDKAFLRSQHRQQRNTVGIAASSVRTSPPPTSRWRNAQGERDKLPSPSRSPHDEQMNAAPMISEPKLNEANLRHRFKRDNGPSTMLDDVEDELSGPTTISSSKDMQENHASNRPIVLKNPRDSSPSDIRPTPFSTRDTVKRLPPGKRAGPAEGIKKSVPVRSLVCSEMQLSSGDIKLAWDSQAYCFHVLHNDQRQRVLEGDEFARIGPNVRLILSSKTAPRLLLRCAADSTSNGNILIDFLTMEGKQDFLKKIPKAKFMDTERGQIEKRWQNLTEEFLARAKQDRTSDEYQPSHEAPHVEEQIVYESELSAEEQSADLLPFGHQALKPAHEGSDPRRKPKHDTDPPFCEGDRRSTRRSLGVSKPVARSMSPLRWTQHNDLASWRHPVVYPPLPALRRVTIDKGDIARLDEGEFLNDTILSFALREIEESMTPQRREEIYMFNTFFYTALSTKHGRKAFNFDAVKTWTRKVDIFKYPFVVVPINVSLHWFVAIICNLPSVRSPPQDDAAMDDVGKIEPVDDREKHPTDAEEEDAKGPSEADDEPKSSQIPDARMSQLSLQDGDENQTGDARIKKNKTKKHGSKKHAPPVRKLSPKGPFVITLDSLNLPRSPEVRYLKDYIAAEAMDKLEIVLDPKEFQGVTAKGIPEQNNFCDCGIFAVRYIRALAEDPHGFVKNILERQVDEQRFDGFDPSEVRNELRTHLLQLSKANEEEFNAKRAQKHQSKRGAPQPTVEPDQPATSPVNLTGNDGNVSEGSEQPVAVAVAESPPLLVSTIREFIQQRGSRVVSPPSQPAEEVSLSGSSTP